MFCGLLLAIPSSRPVSIDAVGQAPTLADLETHLPAAFSIVDTPDESGLWAIKNESNTIIAKVGKTLPIAQDVVGYRGPTESLITFDEELKIDHVDLIESYDTPEHVDAVVADKQFFEQFRGWPWGGPKTANVDAVSGATLTSLALAEGILKRIGGQRPSLVFSDPITEEERRNWLADEHVGETLIRTGPLSDDIAGYQGPTELLLRIAEDTVNRLELRYSYDNEPYVDYVRTEFGFWKLFEGKSIDELAAFDPKAERVEGVSGATMTSLAVADTVVAAAKRIQSHRNQAETPEESANLFSEVRWSIAEIVTVAVLGILYLLSRAKQFRHKLLRRVWLVAMIVVIGVWSGNLISMALITGWSAEGIAWRLAPGLTFLVFVALTAPPVFKANPYCNHLCPHGAVQQLIRPTSKSKRRWRISGNLQKWLTWIPGVTLSMAYVMVVTWPSVDLSSWEPFHAYLFRIAGWGAFALAGASLLLAFFVPMGYCRLGCPTGRMLDYLRRSSTSSRLQFADGVAVALLLYAVSMRSLG